MENTFKIKNKLLIFVSTIIITILITRLITNWKDLDIIVFGYELHHFYYGLALLIILNISILFGRHYPRLHLYLSAFAIGLIADEFLFIMKGIRNFEYPSTFTHSIFITLIIITIVIIIYFHVLDIHGSKKYKKPKK